MTAAGDPVVMQGRDAGQREFGVAESLAEEFADLFASGRARPSIPADVIASVTVLQGLQGLSDRQTAEKCRALASPGMTRSPAMRWSRLRSPTR